MITVRRAAQDLDTEPWRVWHAILHGHLPVTLHRGRVRITRVDWLAFLDD